MLPRDLAAGVDQPDEDERTLLATLIRGLRVLEAVAASGGTATAKSLSRALGLKHSTCYHLLRTLRSERYLVRLQGGYWDVGPQAGSLSRRIQLRSGPAPELASILTRLHNRTHETAYIAGWMYGQIVLQHFIEGDQTLRVQGLDVGYVGNMHARASCRAILAHLPETEIETIFSGVELARMTPNTICTYDGLIEQLARIRRQGYALDLEEFSEGVCCASAAFFGPDGTPSGSLTVSTPSARFRAHRDYLIAAVRESALLATNFLQTRKLRPPVRQNARA